MFCLKLHGRLVKKALVECPAGRRRPGLPAIARGTELTLQELTRSNGTRALLIATGVAVAIVAPCKLALG